MDMKRKLFCALPNQDWHRSIKQLFSVCMVSAGLWGSQAWSAGPAATIEDLSWMTGNYAVDLGANTLEENWIGAENSSIAAMVRMSGEAGTSMFEVITIEEVGGSLELRLQQYDSGYQPRTEGPLVMELAMITDNHVHFTRISGEGMPTLGYTKSGDTFTIHVGQADGSTRDIPLQARSLWE
jgi:hypothetical protein